MKCQPMTVMVIAALALAVSALPEDAVTAETSKVAPKDRVVTLYFHRTERCPTCLKMGSYTEKAINTAFAKQRQQGTVEFHYIDFQDKKNAALAKGYKISGPALVVIKVRDNRVKEYMNLKDIWTKVREKPQFVKYVRENVEAYLTDRAPARDPA